MNRRPYYEFQKVANDLMKALPISSASPEYDLSHAGTALVYSGVNYQVYLEIYHLIQKDTHEKQFEF